MAMTVVDHRLRRSARARPAPGSARSPGCRAGSRSGRTRRTARTAARARSSAWSDTWAPTSLADAGRDDQRRGREDGDGRGQDDEQAHHARPRPTCRIDDRGRVTAPAVAGDPSPVPPVRSRGPPLGPTRRPWPTRGSSASASSCTPPPTARTSPRRPAGPRSSGTRRVFFPDHFGDQLAPVPALDGRGRRHHRRCGSAPWSSTTTTSTRSSWPRSAPPSTCCRAVASSSASAPGWMTSRLRPVGHPDGLAQGAGRPDGGGHPGPEERLRRRSAGLRRRALHDHRLRRAAQAGPEAPPAVPHRWRAASGCCRSPAARPTSSGSTRRSTAARSTPTRPAPAAPSGPTRSSRGSRPRPATATPTSRSTCSTFAAVVTDDREGTIEAMAPLFGLEPAEVGDHPHALVRHRRPDLRGPRAPPRSVGRVLR